MIYLKNTKEQQNIYIPRKGSDTSIIPEEYKKAQATKTVRVEENGKIIITPDGNFDAMKTVDLTVDVSGSGPVKLQEKTAVKNGPVTADTGYTGLSKVNVEVPQKKIQEKKYVSISENSIWGFGPDKGFDGMAEVEVDVNVPTPIFTTEELVATENKVYRPKSNGYSKVTVNVPKGEFRTQEKTVTANGDVVPDPGYDGLSKVKVNVPEPFEYTLNLKEIGYSRDDNSSASHEFKLVNDIDGAKTEMGRWDINTTNGDGKFKSTYGEKYFPKLNMDRLTSAVGMFQNNKELVYIPAIRANSLVDASHMFDGCKGLSKPPVVYSNSLKKADYMYANLELRNQVDGNDGLQISLPTESATGLFSGSKGSSLYIWFNMGERFKSMRSFFYGCSGFSLFLSGNVSGITDFSDIFSNCTGVTILKLFDDIKADISFADVSADLPGIISHSLYDFRGNGDMVSNPTVTLGDNYDRLPESDIQRMIDKGWNVER